MTQQKHFGLAIQTLYEPETIAEMTAAEFEGFWKALGEAIRMAAIARNRLRMAQEALKE